MAIKGLSAQQIQEELKLVPLWELEGDRIARKFRFPTFNGSIEFVNQIAHQAEAMDHHPDILVEYNQVTLRLSTHDAGGLSERDFRFAQAVDRVKPKK